MNKQVFEYNGSPITFQMGEATMMNATQMAKPFGKRVAEWLRLPSTKEFLSVLQPIRKSDSSPMGKSHRLVETINGIGTWMHEDVALEFARWLSPQFAIWCNDRIKELLKYGMTATPQTIESILADPCNAIKLLTALQDERERNATLTIQRDTYHSENRRLLKLKERQDALMLEQAPLVEYAQNVLESNDTFTTTQIAKELDMTAQALHKFLHTAGVMYKQGGQWFMYARFQSKGYVKTREHTYKKKDGRTGIMLSTVWTEAGRMFVRKLFLFKHSIKNEAE